MVSDDQRLAAALSFDAVAETYASARPHYPRQLFDDLAATTGAGPDATVLEIGCGPGTATEGLLAQGWRVLAVEPGARMAEVATARLGHRGLSIEPGTFEAWDPAGRQFDLVFSATAFHWVEPGLRWTKAAGVLRPRGWLALATNRTVGGSTFEEVHRLTAAEHRDAGARYNPSPSERQLREALLGAPPDIGGLWGVADPKAGPGRAGSLFEPPVVHTYAWEQEYEAEEAARLLSTYSAYLLLEPERRSKLLDSVTRTIEQRFGGVVTRRYLSVLALARRASHPRNLDPRGREEP